MNDIQKVHILLCTLVVTGCMAPMKYYGIKDGRDLSVTRQGESISYKYKSGDETIKAYGYSDNPLWIDIKLDNLSKKPIETNYYVDACAVRTESGTVFGLDKRNIEYATTIEYGIINPGSSRTVHYSIPPNSRLDAPVERIECVFGANPQTKVTLVPIK